MKQNPQAYASQLEKNRVIRSSVRQMLPILSLFVILGVFWSLKLTGITMAGEAFCGKAEHAHDADCETRTLVCTLEESAEHTHTDPCYQISNTCQQEVHTHIEACYSDITADVETSAVWEQTLSGLEDTELTAERIAAAARSQLGYTESTLNFQVDELGVRRGYTRYGEWYGHPYGDWTAMFVSFCLHYAGVTEDMAPYNSGAEAMRLGWEEIGVYQAPDSMPEPGDVLFLDKDANGAADAAAIITGCEAGTLRVIEGDLENAVAEAGYQTTDAAVMGYGSIRSVIYRSLTEEDLSGIEDVNTRIAALPTEEEVLARMDSMDQDSVEFQDWYYALVQEVKSVNAAYEALSADLRLFVTDTAKMDALAWTWQTAALSEDTVASVNVYHINLSSDVDAIESLATIIYGGSAHDVMGNNARNFSWWHAIVVDKKDNGYYVSEINREQPFDKWDIRPQTKEGFVLMVQSDRDALAAVAVGQSVQITPFGFYDRAPTVSSTPLGTLTFTTPKDNTQQLDTVPSASTKDWITINLFNYGENINTMWESDTKYPGFQSPEQSAIADAGRMDFGNSITAEIGNSTVHGGSGAINGVNTKGIDYPISGAISSELLNGYPALADGTSLAYLFSDNVYAKQLNGKNADGEFENIDRLFQYDASTGKYYFDSRDNNAMYNAEDSTFTLYKQIMTPNFIIYPFGNFLPLNDIRTQTTQTTQIDPEWFQTVAESARQKYYNGMGEKYRTLYTVLTEFDATMDANYGTWNYANAMQRYFALQGLPLPEDNSGHLSNLYTIDYDEPTDFFFGMSMHIDFMQPKNGLTGIDGKQPMKYTFAGDDDVWIYVDGKLFLDLSGIHRHVGGTIDFENGKVYYYNLLRNTGDVDTEPYKTVEFKDILGTTEGLNAKGAFEDYSSHTLDFYYMERGSGSSVCKIEFNFPLLKKNGITVTKELEDIDRTEVLGDPDFRFQVFRENGTELLIGQGVEYSILDQNGNLIGTKKTGENGIVTIKAGQSAHFGNILENEGAYFVREVLPPEIVRQYAAVTVDGDDAAIASDDFQGADSAVKNMSDGSASFLFQNHVDPDKLASLEISKELLYYNEGDQDKQFTILLDLDGVPVPSGTDYTLIAADGTETPASIADAGRLTLKHGQTARFDKVLAGSRIGISEDGDSAAGYVVTYAGQNITLTEENGGVTGMIAADVAAQITVTNAPDGARLPIEGTKVLLYPDGASYTYTFELRQIVSPTDTSPVEGGTRQRQTVTLAGGSTGFTFHLVYPVGTEPGTYYYQITEENADGASGMDAARYIAEVTLAEAEGVLMPTLNGLYRNGSDAEGLVFTNAILRSLTVEKTVENPISTDDSFRFEITASVDGMNLEGDYSCTAPDGSTSITFTDGKAVVDLKHNERVTVSGLPYGTAWSVTEVDAYGYFTKCGTTETPMMSGSSVSGSLTEDETVAFVNFGGAELPATGSYARMMYTLGGWGIMLASLVYGFGSRRKRERRYK